MAKRDNLFAKNTGIVANPRNPCRAKGLNRQRKRGSWDKQTKTQGAFHHETNPGLALHTDSVRLHQCLNARQIVGSKSSCQRTNSRSQTNSRSPGRNRGDGRKRRTARCANQCGHRSTGRRHPRPGTHGSQHGSESSGKNPGQLR